MQNIISASILSADLMNFGEAVDAVVDAGVDNIHFDVMDMHYVPNLTFGPMFCQAIRERGVTLPIDVHLMVTNPEAFVEPFAKAGANMITFHPSTAQDVQALVTEIKQAGMQAGLVFNPHEPVDVTASLFKELDMILLMTVNPGFAGQAFMPEVLDKIATTRARINAEHPGMLLGVDGGVKENNVKPLADLGANFFVMGSGIYSADNVYERVSQIKQKLGE